MLQLFKHNRLAEVDLSGESELLEKSDAASLQVEYLRKAVAIGLFYEARCFERGLCVPRDLQKSTALFSKVCTRMYSTLDAF